MNKTSTTDLILNWYDNQCYNFPWRKNIKVYNVWISEIMLQQTQAKTVIPYYKKWINKYPNFLTIKNANINDLLKLWEGLGYYNRVHNFYKASILINTKYSNKIPNSYNEFIKLPGVGPYIAAAISSICFNEIRPAIDGNIVRVISRLESINLIFPKSKKIIFYFLEKIISHQRPGDFNQALMDLGREICKPKQPLCNICPLKLLCSSYSNNSVHKYPIKKEKTTLPKYNVAIGIIWHKKKILISKRKKNVLLAGLWEFPGGKIEKNESPAECVVREAYEELNVNIKIINFFIKIQHAYSHFKIEMHVFQCKFISGNPKAKGCDDWKWIDPIEVKNYVFPKSCHKIFNILNWNNNDYI